MPLLLDVLASYLTGVGSSASPGAGEALGRNIDRMLGLFVSGTITLAVAALSLKALSMSSSDDDDLSSSSVDGMKKKKKKRASDSLDGKGGNGGGAFDMNVQGFLRALVAGILSATVQSFGKGKNGPSTRGSDGEKSSHQDSKGDAYYKSAYKANEGEKNENRVITHRGSCHCNSVQFALKASMAPVARDCKSKFRYPHVSASSQTFHLTRGTRYLNIYYVTLTKTSDRSMAAHGFCSRCGVHVFRAPSHMKDLIEVNLNCIDGNTADAMVVEHYDEQLPTAMGAGVPSHDNFNLASAAMLPPPKVNTSKAASPATAMVTFEEKMRTPSPLPPKLKTQPSIADGPKFSIDTPAKQQLSYYLSRHLSADSENFHPNEISR